MEADHAGGKPPRMYRFSVWDGTQDPLGDDVDALFDRLSEDVFHGWDFETALRRLLSQGWRDRSGRRRRPPDRGGPERRGVDPRPGLLARLNARRTTG